MARAGLLAAVVSPAAVWAAGVDCKKAFVTYDSGSIPVFTGSEGPFGAVCEVGAGDSFPEVPPLPKNLGGKAFVVRSSFPSHFMEESLLPLSGPSAAKIRKLAANSTASVEQVSDAARVDCGGGLYVGAVGDIMNEKVYGASGDSSAWTARCAQCGLNLEAAGKLKPGWFCSVDYLGIVPTGVSLQRLADAAADTVRISLESTHTVLGFGGAFTDAAAVADEQLLPELREKWVEGYYGAQGAGYTVGRVPFGGADFSRRAYSLDSQSGDFELKGMCLRDDRANATCGTDFKIPILKQALAAEPSLKLFFSPWSAPAWMKTNGKLVGGRVRGLQKDASPDDKRYAQAWAQMYVKFVDLMKEQGIKFWGLTLQNEPSADQFVSWNSASVSGDEELRLLELVGQAMREKHPEIKIMVHDDQYYTLHKRLVQEGDGILKSKFMDGVAFHWYGSFGGTAENTTAEYVTPLPLGPPAFGGGIEVKQIFDKYIAGTDKFMLATEACTGYLDSKLHLLRDHYSMSNNRGVRPGDWSRGYRVSRDIYYQLVNGASGWTDWNLLLRADGGPNWAGNNVDAPILASPDGSKLWVSPMFFHLAHWAKYVPPGSKVLRVDSSSSKLKEIAAFLRPDGRLAVVVLADAIDGHDAPPAGRTLTIEVAGVTLEVEISTASITTAVFDLPTARELLFEDGVVLDAAPQASTPTWLLYTICGSGAAVLVAFVAIFVKRNRRTFEAVPTYP